MRKTWRQTTLLASLGLGLALVSNWAQAAIYDRNGNKLPDAEVNSSQVNWELLSAEKGRNYNGVGLLEQESEGFCTAFFLNTGGDDNAPAYAVTNGHCADLHTEPAAKEILINRPSNKVFKLNYFANAVTRVRPVPVRQVVYATMKGTDIAILELDTTFKQLVKEGFTPLKIEGVSPSVGEPIEVIGIPMTGVKSSLSYLHRVVCQVGQSVNLREDVYHWEKAIRTRCSVVGGMSGSPVVSLKSNQVVAIANTGVDDEALKQPECSKNRPCEVSSDGRVATFPKENYAQRVSNIPSCFDSKGIFTLNLPSCALEKP
jgi:V8-like Glu-specific endopeptidase